MIKGFGQTDEAVARYFYDLHKPEDEILKEVRERSTARGLPEIQVGAADALHLEVLVRMANAKKVVEIGTLGGYSGICIARALPQDGKLYTFEYDPRHVEVAKESFQKAGVASKVEIFTGPALKNLPSIESKGPFDLVFIDADKINYPNYLAWATAHLRVGGTLIADNTFAWGYIAPGRTPPPENVPATRELRVFNETIAKNSKFRVTILPTGEGLTVAVKLE